MKTTKQNQSRSILLALLASATLAQAGTPVAAPVAEPVPSGDGWWFRAAPYGWLTAMEGDVGVGPLSTPIDISMQDTLDSLDMTFMGVFEAGYDRWSFGVDVMYAKLSQDIDAGGHIFDSFRFEQKQLFITPAVRYRIIDTSDYHMSVYAGARVTTMEVDLTGRFAHGGGQQTRGDNSTWVDPLVGIGGQADIGDRWFFRYSADIGGFGVSSELIWNAFAGFGYNFSDSASVILGYRGLGMDYTDGPLTLDVISHGPVLGAEFRF
jgi:opacity protein-like surface antigen